MEGFRKAVGFLLDLASPLPADSDPSVGRNLCRAFLTMLSSEPGTSERDQASGKLRQRLEDREWRDLASFFQKSCQAIERELEAAMTEEPELRKRMHELGKATDAGLAGRTPMGDLIQAFRAVFLPQAVGVEKAWDEKVEELRKRRSARIETLCSDPVDRPAREILWTSNALLTVPPKDARIEDLHFEPDLRLRLETEELGQQKYWYDHPVQMGVRPEGNEILYGLRGLSEMLQFEKKRATAHPDDRLKVVLSVSVTHPALQAVAGPYIEQTLDRAAGVRDLDIHVVTETDTERLLEGFLLPAARAYGLEGAPADLLPVVFGVNGPYGRHYNFLKAVAALWQVIRDPSLKATFKIDLDQVFPQDRLVRELDRSAFELLTTPLWGASARDTDGHSILLGMLAGALVNQADIDRGLFTPDVTLPKSGLSADRWVFATQVPQALSTAAEMMARCDTPPLDGKECCLTRVHVTGGTNGIRIDALRRFRPFTLSRISRAEDQAYLMSALHRQPAPYLRYVHAPGLIMRHDKAGFAGEAIQTAAAGKAVGDYERMILFSHYARALPWPWQETQTSLNPFTGSFVHRIPLTTALVAFTLKALISSKNGGKVNFEDFLEVGVHKLGPLIDAFQEQPYWLRRSYEQERMAWGSYYDILDRIGEDLRRENPQAVRLAERADSILEATRLHITEG